jgi:hypothetical protein
MVDMEPEIGRRTTMIYWPYVGPLWFNCESPTLLTLHITITSPRIDRRRIRACGVVVLR